MPNVTIDGATVEVPAGATILDATARLGIAVPTLCHLDGCERFTSCLLCVVEETATGRLLPSCSALAQDGMALDTRTPAVRDARRMVLELLLSEHVGDCEAPCRRACPAHMDIPLMIRQIGRGELPQAIATVKRDIALPAVLGRICPAPCEKACRRGQVDSAVSICLLKRDAADVDLAAAVPLLPPVPAASGKRVAVVGAGPAGLAAAWYLQQLGHACTIFDEWDAPGGKLYTHVPAAELPRDVLAREIDTIRRLGVAFRQGVRVGRDVTLTDLRASHDAVVLAVGALDAPSRAAFDVPFTDRGVKVNPETLQADVPGVFAGGAAIGVCKMAVRACADGKRMARSADLFVRGQEVSPAHKRFNCAIGRLLPGEAAEVLKLADRGARREPAGGTAAGFTREEAAAEAARCLHCDCRKTETCRLRAYSDACGAEATRLRPETRKPLALDPSHADVVYEPGKCIRCGLCIRVTRREGEPVGLAFVGRGYDMTIGVPFHEALGAALQRSAAACVGACPTGALAWKNREEAEGEA